VEFYVQKYLQMFHYVCWMNVNFVVFENIKCKYKMVKNI